MTDIRILYLKKTRKRMHGFNHKKKHGQTRTEKQTSMAVSTWLSYCRSMQCTPNIITLQSTKRGARSKHKCVFKQRPTGFRPGSSPTPWTRSTKSSCPNSLNKQQRPRCTARVVPKATVQNYAKNSGHPSNPLRPSENHRSEPCFPF